MSWTTGNPMDDIWNPNAPELDPETGQYKAKLPTMPQPTGSQPYGGPLPVGYSQGEVDEWLSRNPGDAHRVMSALNDRGPQAQQQAAPQYQTPAQQWNAQPAMSGQSSDLFKLLMERAQQPTSVDRNSPQIRQQVDPAVAQQERASRNYLDDIAERSGPLANMHGERRLAAERSGQAAGALEAEVIGRESDKMLQERMLALSEGARYMTAQERAALEREIAYLMDASRSADRDLSRSGMLMSNDQFMRELALREYDTTNKWDYAWSGGY